MQREETGALLGAALVGLVGTPVLLMMVDNATDPLLVLVARLAVYAVIPVIAARVAFASGLAAGRRQSGRLTPPNELGHFGPGNHLEPEDHIRRL